MVLSVSVSLPEELVELMVDHFVDFGYASLSEYVRELIRNDLRQNGVMPGREPASPKSIRSSRSLPKALQRW